MDETQKAALTEILRAGIEIVRQLQAENLVGKDSIPVVSWNPENGLHIALSVTPVPSEEVA
jgi:hypothetical protein